MGWQQPDKPETHKNPNYLHCVSSKPSKPSERKNLNTKKMSFYIAKKRKTREAVTQLCSIPLLDLRQRIHTVSGLFFGTVWLPDQFSTRHAMQPSNVFTGVLGFMQPIPGCKLFCVSMQPIRPENKGRSYLPVRAGLVIRKANQPVSLLALHSACGVG